MDIFEKIGKKFGIIKEEEIGRAEQFAQRRNNLKLNLAVQMYQKGCTDEEIDEVLSIIQSAEDDIQIIKNSLVGTNINPEGDPGKPLYDGIDKIRKRQQEMQKELNEAIQRILNK